jgi:hypothetical protein
MNPNDTKKAYMHSNKRKVDDIVCDKYKRICNEKDEKDDSESSEYLPSSDGSDSSDSCDSCDSGDSGDNGDNGDNGDKGKYNLNDYILTIRGLRNFKDNINSNIQTTQTTQTKPPQNSCTKPDCDHKVNSKKFTVSTIKQFTTLQDLIDLGNTFHCKMNKTYNGIDLKSVYNMQPHLKELGNMIGLNEIKEEIIDQILFFTRGLHVDKKDMLHTIISGPSGVGKTHFAKCLGKICASMGLLSKGDFVKIGREDLVAKYLGQTTHQVANLFKKYKGCVLFLDEAYSLGSGRDDTGDYFAKEAIDKLTGLLEEERDIMMIIAGYEQNMNDSLFSVNEGLRRRFTYKYNISGYNAKELYEIFEMKLSIDSWKIENNDKEKIKKLFRKNYHHMPKFGGDVETLILHSKLYNNRSIDYLKDGKVINYLNVKSGFAKLAKCRKNFDSKKNFEGMF